MKSQISFTTDIFETKRTKAESIGDRSFGKDLATWLAKEGAGGKFEFGEPFHADWGWAIEVTAGKEKFLVGCGIMIESIGDQQADWLITVEKERKWKVLSPKDSPMRTELCDLIQNILRAKAHIREIRWTDQVGHFARKNVA
jgi:hypothetical protein